MKLTTNTPIEYFVEIGNVQEVSLLGGADLASARELLEPADLFPFDNEGKAEVMITSNNARWMGFRFQEIVFTVFASRQSDGESLDGTYLMQGFTSRYFFAFSERFFFGTPYRQATIRVEERLPASIDLKWGSHQLFQAKMVDERHMLRQGEEEWEGPVYLPRKPGKAGPGNLFYARLRGDTTVYPFDASHDTVEVNPLEELPVFRWLSESNFEAREWHVRQNCKHARSKTHKRVASM